MIELLKLLTLASGLIVATLGLVLIGLVVLSRIDFFRKNTKTPK